MSGFTDRVRAHLDGLHHVSPGACPGCSTCEDLGEGNDYDARPDDWHDIVSEGAAFSRAQCDSCGSGMAGARYPAHALDVDNRIVHLDICTDCIQYHANGTEPEPKN